MPDDGLGCQARVAEAARAVFETIANSAATTRHTRVETDAFIFMIVSIYNVEIISSRRAYFRAIGHTDIACLLLSHSYLRGMPFALSMENTKKNPAGVTHASRTSEKGVSRHLSKGHFSPQNPRIVPSPR